MTQVVNRCEELDPTVAIRNTLTDRLLADGMITSAGVEAAFRRVPRHLFVPPDTPLEVTYDPDNSVAVKRDAHGVIISSISAPFIQARMIEQAGLTPGMRVLEIGSGGCNAALLAEVVGPDGRVLSIDIDAEVTDRAAASLDAAGYSSRVRVMRADAEHDLPEAGTFDAIIVTVGAWDIPPVWWQRLAPGGRLVVPLGMNGITRSIAFESCGDRLVSTSAEVCGFVTMQGAGQHPERVFLLPDLAGRHVRLRFDHAVPQHLDMLDGVMAADRSEMWSGVVFPRRTSFADLHLWFACYLPGFCQMAVDEGTDLARERGTWFPFATVVDDSLAYLAVRPDEASGGVEFGARTYGAHGQRAAAVMVEQIQAWDRQARPGPAPTFAFWPGGCDRSDFPQTAGVCEKTHGLVTISWPPSR